MRITEFINPVLAVLHRNMLLNEAPIGTATISRSWNSNELGGNPSWDFKPLGNVGRFTVGTESAGNGVTNVLLVDRNDEIVGKLELVTTETDKNKFKFWRVFKAILKKDLQGRGIMPKVYAFIVNHGYNLRADEEQSIGSQILWAKLSKDPSVNVYAALHNQYTGEIEYSDVEGLKQLQANFHLYHDEMAEELKYIHNEIDSLKAIRDRVNDEYINIPKDVKDPEKYLSAEYDRLTTEINELELDLSELIRQHRLETQKDMYLLAIPAKKSDTVTESQHDRWAQLDREEELKALELVKKDGMNIMYVYLPSEAVQLAAVKQNPFAIYEIDEMKSKTVILTAILGMLKNESIHNAKSLTKDFKKQYPDWPEWAIIDRSIKALRK